MGFRHSYYRIAALSFLLFGNVSCLTRGRSNSINAADQQEKAAARRQVMESVVTLQERRDCIPFEDVPNYVKTSSNTDEVCLNNGCSGDTSCCRIFNWLVCDDTNNYPYLACVCNDFTRTPIPTKAPTTSKPTTSPTPLPTPYPTTRQPTKAPTTDEPTVSPTEPSPTLISGINQPINNSDNGLNDSPVMIAGATAGVALLIIIILVAARRREKKKSYLDRADSELFDQMAIEHHVEIESVPSDLYSPGIIMEEDESYTSKDPPGRNARSPLSSQDELDGVFNSSHAGYTHRLNSGYSPTKTRSYLSTDTVDL